MSGRAETTGVIAGRAAISVGRADMPTPRGWKWSKLTSVARLESGHTPSRKHPEYWDGGIPWIGIKDARIHHGKTIRSTLQTITQEGLDNSAARLLPPGTICLSRTASVGYSFVLGDTMATSQDFVNWVCSDEIVPDFLMYAFMAEGEGLKSFGQGTTHTTIYYPEVKALHLCHPPTNEQRRIVARIEELFSRLDAGVGALRHAKAQLQRYRQSVLAAAVTGQLTQTWREKHPHIEPASVVINRTQAPPRPNRYKTRSRAIQQGHPALSIGNPGTTLPKGWVWAQLVEIARMESGHTPSRNHPEWWAGDIPWIGITDAREHHGKIIQTTFQHTNEEGLANSASRLLPAGTVCISRTASVGYVTVMGRDMATSQDFVNWTPTEAVSSDWLRVVFQADTEGLRSFGSGSVHKTIYFPEWLSMHAAIPPRAEQHQIVAEVEARTTAIDHLEAELDRQITRSSRLRQSTLAAAFSGNLTA